MKRLIVLIGVVLFAFTSIVKADLAPDAALQRKLPDAKFDNNSFGDVVDFLRDVTETKISVNWKALEAAQIDKDTPVNFRVRDVTTDKALRILLHQLGFGKAKLGYKVVDGAIIISTADDLGKDAVTDDDKQAMDELRKMAEAGDAKAMYKLGALCAGDIGGSPGDPQGLAMRAMLAKRMPSVQFNNNSLIDVIDFMRDVSGANIIVNWNALDAAKIDKEVQVSVKLKDVKFEKALRAILDEAAPDGQLGYTVNGDVITISTVDDIGVKRDAQQALAWFHKAADAGSAPAMYRLGLLYSGADGTPDDLKRRAAIRAQLDRHLPEINFNRNPFIDVVDFLRDVTGTDIVVNWRALDAAQIDKNTAITVKLKDVAFAQVFTTVLSHVGGPNIKLGYAIEDGVITVSTADDLARTAVPEDDQQAAIWLNKAADAGSEDAKNALKNLTAK